MNDKFIWGLALGMLGGALIVTNSVKARQMVKSGQQQVVEKAETLTKKAGKQEAKSNGKQDGKQNSKQEK